VLADRRILAGAVALVVLVAAVVLGVPLLLGDDAPEPADDARAFLAAWGDGDVAAMEAMVDEPPATFADDLARLTDGLAVESAAYELGDVEVDGDDATAAFDATLALGGLGEWRYEGALALRRAEGGGDGGPDWLVRWSPATVHPDLAEGQRLVRTREWPTRAPITGSDGQPLVEARPAVTIGAVPERLGDPAVAKAALQAELGIDPAEVDAALAAPGVEPNFFVPLATVPQERYDAAEDVIYPIPGLQFRRTTGRSAPSEGFAQHVLGRTAEATAERLDELGAPYQAGDTVGVTGLEARFERRLAGTPAGEVQIVDGDDAVVTTLATIEGTPPEPVATTIDRAVQAAVETVVDGVAKPAAIVVVDPDGNIRGMASRPLTEDLNRALASAYPPGSTFKIVTTDGLLTDGLTPDSAVECAPTADAGGRSFKNFESSSLGTVPFGQAFAESCNTAFVTSVADVPEDQLVAAAERFGFNQDYSVGLTTLGGSYPAPADATEKAAQAIGQGRITASPLHMATVAGTVASGTWEPPTLLTEPTAAEAAEAAEAAGDGAEGEATATTAAGGTVDATGTTAPGGTTGSTAATDGDVAEPAEPTTITDGNRQTLAQLMARVVTDGSGTRAAVPGRTVAGKTGTAEFGEGNPLPTHAWFVGFSGDLAVSVFIEDGGVGGRDAAPVAGALFAALPA
jgi:cell division protein FtsI/penicillin-binding protein 2